MTGDLADLPTAAVMAGGFIIGAIIGSFLAIILTRWPERRSVLAGRSRCDACGTTLGAIDLVPILSYVALRARCRRCGAKIDARHAMIELAAALVGLVSAIAHPLPLAAATMLFGLFLLIIAALDAEHHWLPDALTLPLIPLGLLAAWLGLGPPLLDRAIGAVAGFVLLWVLGLAYRAARGREGLGGGDPKLLAAIGAWVGALQLPMVLLGTGIVGLAVVLAMKARGEAVDRMTKLPLGVLMALAAWPIWLVVSAIRSPTVQNFLL